MQTPCGSAKVKVLYTVEGVPFKTFGYAAKNGECLNVVTEAVSRLCSVALEHGVPLPLIAEQLEHMQCERAIAGQKSCMDEFANALLQIHAEAQQTDFTQGGNHDRGND